MHFNGVFVQPFFFLWYLLKWHSRGNERGKKTDSNRLKCYYKVFKWITIAFIGYSNCRVSYCKRFSTKIPSNRMQFSELHCTLNGYINPTQKQTNNLSIYRHRRKIKSLKKNPPSIPWVPNRIYAKMRLPSIIKIPTK